MRPVRRTFVAGALAGLFAFLTVGLVLAQGGAQLGGKVLTGSEVTIPAGETVDHDLYVFGGTVTSSGTINGDLVAAGGTIHIDGPVKGDILAIGGQISISGPVSGDVRVGGAQVTITGAVAEDVAAAGGQITVDGRVGQDLIVSAGQLTLSGSVAGSTVGNVGTYSKTGTIAGTDGITVNPNQPSAVTPPRANPVLDAVRQFIAVMLVAALVLWLLPRAFAVAEAEVRQNPLPSLGWGAAALIGYIALVIAIGVVVILIAVALAALGFGTLLGVDLVAGFVAIAGITLALVIGAAFVADAIVGLALARAVFDRYGRTGAGSGGSAVAGRDRWSGLWLLAAGAAVIVVLTSLPAIGALVKLVVVLLGLGALWLAWRRGGFAAMREYPAEAATGAPPI